TDKIHLFQAANAGSAVLIFVPVVREKEVIGIITGVLRINELFHSFDTNLGYNDVCFRFSLETRNNLLFDENCKKDYLFFSNFEVSASFYSGDRLWFATITPNFNYLNNSPHKVSD